VAAGRGQKQCRCVIPVECASGGDALAPSHWPGGRTWSSGLLVLIVALVLFAAAGAASAQERPACSWPYGEAELRAVQDQLTAELTRANWGVGVAVEVGCRYSDAFRVELELFNDSSDAVLTAARQLAARWDDRVVVVRLAIGPPVTSIGRPPPTRPPRRLGFAELVRGPCMRGSRAVARVRASAPAKIDRVTVTVRGRRTVFSGRRLSRPLRVRLRPRTSTVRVVVRLRVGGTVSATRRLRRCSRS
jgi:hypothetical protein